MSRTQPNDRARQQAARLDQLSYDITKALEHAARELSQASIYPSDTLAEHTSGGDPNSHWPPDSLVNVFEIRSRREDIRDWLDGLEGYVTSGRTIVDDLLGLRTGAPELFDAGEYAQRCSGKVDPTCEQWASEQRLPDGTKVTTLCVSCFANACLVCCNEPAAQRRVDGVRAGETCYKRTLRARVKEAAA